MPDEVPLVDPGPDVLPHAGGAQPLDADDVGRRPGVRRAVQLLEYGVGAVEVDRVRRCHEQQVLADRLHRGFGQRSGLRPLLRLLVQELAGQRLPVTLAHQDRRFEVVGHGEHRRDLRTGVGAQPAGDLGVGPAALQQRVPPDELDLVEQQHPADVPGGPQQPGREGPALPRQLTRRHGTEVVDAGLINGLEGPPQIGGPDRVAGPEADDGVDHLARIGGVGGAQPLVHDQGGREPVRDGPRVKPADQVAVGGRVGVQGRRGFGEDTWHPGGRDQRLDGGAVDLRRVVQGRLLADDDGADDETPLVRHGAQVREQVALARPETSRDQPAAGTEVEQGVEGVLDLVLPGSEGGDGVSTRDARPERFHGPSACDVGGVHATASRRTSSRTRAACGLVRRRSLTSSATRSCKAV